jgi:hypothetical protein
VFEPPKDCAIQQLKMGRRLFAHMFVVADAMERTKGMGLYTVTGLDPLGEEDDDDEERRRCPTPFPLSLGLYASSVRKAEELPDEPRGLFTHITVGGKGCSPHTALFRANE